MTLRSAYLALFVLGTILPLAQFVPWFTSNGPNVTLFFNQLFASPISSFFAWDVIVSALTVIVFALTDQRLRGSQKALVTVATLLTGVSCGLPLTLWLRSGSSPERAASGGLA